MLSSLVAPLRSRARFSLVLSVVALGQSSCRSPRHSASSTPTATATVTAPLASSSGDATPPPQAEMNGALEPDSLGAWEEVYPGVRTVVGVRSDSSGTRHAWRVLRIELSRARLSPVAVAESSLPLLGRTPGVLFAVNGGYFDEAKQPTGLLASGTARFGTQRRGGGSGVLVVTAQRAELLSADSPISISPDTELALQCGPRLVEPGGKLGIKSDDGQRSPRTVVCLREGGKVVDVALAWSLNNPALGPGLFDVAQWLAHPDALSPQGCEAALNLDGGPSTSLTVPGKPQFAHAPRGPVPFAIIGTAR